VLSKASDALVLCGLSPRTAAIATADIDTDEILLPLIPEDRARRLCPCTKRLRSMVKTSPADRPLVEQPDQCVMRMLHEVPKDTGIGEYAAEVAQLLGESTCS
jgi:hypothetical protein